MIIGDAIVLEKPRFRKCFPFTRKQILGVCKFLWFAERIRKALFSSRGRPRAAFLNFSRVELASHADVFRLVTRSSPEGTRDKPKNVCVGLSLFFTLNYTREISFQVQVHLKQCHPVVCLKQAAVFQRNFTQNEASFVGLTECLYVTVS